MCGTSVENYLFISCPFTLFLIGSHSVSPPVHACPDLPPASHSDLGAGGLAGVRLVGWLESSSSLFSTAASLFCSSLPQSWNCWCSILEIEWVIVCIFRTHSSLPLIQNWDLTFVTISRNENSVIDFVFSSVCSCSSIAEVRKVKFLHCVVLKELNSVILCFDKLKPSECSFGTSDEQNHVSCQKWPSPQPTENPQACWLSADPAGIM